MSYDATTGTVPTLAIIITSWALPRSYVIGESVYSAEIRSDSLDFREDGYAELIPITLPGAVRQQALTIMRALMLK